MSRSPGPGLLAPLALLLLAAPAPAPAEWRRLSAGLPGSQVTTFGMNGRATDPLVFFEQDAEIPGAFELHRVDLRGGSPERVSAVLPPGAEVDSYASTLDGLWVVYLAPQLEAGQPELFRIPASGPPGSWLRLSEPLPAGRRVHLAWPSPASDRVAYLADRDFAGAPELFVVPIGGGPAVKINAPLPDATRAVTDFWFTPDGSRLVYLQDESFDEAFELFAAPAGGGAPPVQLNGAFLATSDVVGFAWAEGGERIVYLADPQVDERFELFSVPVATGGGGVKLNHALAHPQQAINAVRVAGDVVVYRVYDSVDDTDSLWSVGASGGTPLPLVSTTVAGEYLPFLELTPDGATLLFVAPYEEGGVTAPHLFRVSTGGGPAERLSAGLSADEEVNQLAVSPDGAFALFRIYDALLDRDRFEAVPVTGGPPQPLLAGSQSHSWGGHWWFSPDGDRVAIHGDLESDGVDELWIGELDGSWTRKASGPMAPGGDATTWVRWAADGRTLLYLADQQSDGEVALYAGDGCLFCSGFEWGSLVDWSSAVGSP